MKIINVILQRTSITNNINNILLLVNIILFYIFQVISFPNPKNHIFFIITWYLSLVISLRKNNYLCLIFKNFLLLFFLR